MDSKRIKEKTIKILKSIVGMLISIGIASLFVIFDDAVQRMAYVGYIGVFLACAAANSSVFVPASSTIIVMSAAVSLNPLLCGVLGGLGAAAGEQVSYWFGRSGKIMIDDTPKIKKLETKLKKHGFLIILLFALIPNPVFDIAGATAGFGKMNWIKYTSACIIGKIPKMIFFAFLGVWVLTQLVLFVENHIDFPGSELLEKYMRELINSIA